MTSGLFNTGETGDSAEITSNPLAVQPSTSKFMGHDLSAEKFDSDLDMNMFEDLGDGFADPLGDASMDSFTDLTALLTENTFLDQAAAPANLTFLDLEGEAKSDFDLDVKPQLPTMKRTFAEIDDTSDLGRLSASVGLTKPTSDDHDYSAKRPRMSTVSEDSSLETMEEVFFAPAPSPTPSTSTSTPTTSGGSKPDKHRIRREKNNVASKRSRETRKQKFVDMEAEAERLVIDNARLEQRVVDLERLAKQMKEILVAKMAGK